PQIQARWTWPRDDDRGGSLDRGDFVGTERNREGIHLRVRDEIDCEACFVDLGHGFADHTRIVFRQPVLEERARYANSYRPRVLGDEAGGLEPGVKDVPIDLGFDAREDLIPEVHFSRRTKLRRGFAPPIPPFPAVYRRG